MQTPSRLGPALLLAAALLALTVPVAAQTTYTWNGRGLPVGTPPNQIPGDSWFNPNSWSPAGVPGPGDTAILHHFDPPTPPQGLGSHPRLYGQSVTVAEITFSSSRVDQQGVTLSNGTGTPTVTVTRAFSFSAGTMSSIRFVCAATCNGGISGNLPKSIAPGELVNEGTVTWNDAQALGGNNATITNRGTFRLDAPGAFMAVGGGTFVNYGTLVKTGGGTTTMGTGVVFKNEGGTVRAESGTLGLAAPSSWIPGHFQGAGRIEGPGLVRLALSFDGTPWSDTLTVAGPTEITRNTSVVGEVAVAACDGCLRWTGGTLSGGTTRLTVLPGSTLDVEPAANDASTSINGATLHNRGILRFRGPNAMSAVGTLLNEGTLEFHGDGQAIAGGLELVHRALLVRRGAGTTYLGGVNFVSEGATVRVEEGVLALASPTGGLVNVELFDGTRVEGAGTLRLRASARRPWTGTTTVTGNLELAAGNLTGDVTVAACDGCFRWTGGAVASVPTGTTLRIPPGGSLDVEGAADKSVTGTLLNRGTVRWHDGGIVGNGTVLNEGRFEVASGQRLLVQFRQATPGAEFVSAPGLDTLTVGTFALTHGHLQLQVGPGGRSDRITAGQVTLGGALTLEPGEPYTPAVGDTFTLTRSTSTMAGTFSGVTGFGLGGASLTPGYTSQEARVTVGPPGGAGLTVAPDPVQGGAVRTLNVGGAGFSAGTAARLECAGCADPGGHGVLPATVVSQTPSRLTVTVDLRHGDAYGGYDLVVTGDGAGRVPVEVLPVPLVVTAAVTDADAAEDGHLPGRITVTANRINDVARPIAYSLDGTALLYTDYATDTPRGRVVLPAGRRSVDVSVLPLQDAEVEPGETVALALTPGADYAVGGPTAGGAVTIADGRSPAAFFVVTVQPTSGGAAGSAVLRAVGQGITPGATLALQGPTSLPGTDPHTNATGTMVTAVVDLDGAPLGVYDVVVTNGGGATQTFPGAFTVEPPEAPELFVSATGPAAYRPDQISRYTVTVTNRGNVDAVAVPLWVAVQTEAASVLEPAFDVLPMDEPPGGFPGWDDIPLTRDTLGQTTMPLFLPVVPAGESITLAFRARSHRFSTWTTQGMLNSLAPDAALTREGAALVARIDPNVLESCLLNVAGLALDLIPGVDCVQGGANWLVSATINLYGVASSTVHNHGAGSAGNAGQMLAGLVGVIAECAASSFPPVRVVSIAMKVLSGGITFAACAPLFRRTPGDDVSSDEVSSLDPNDKLGPDGYGSARYRTDADPFAYTIRFENLDTATAPAAEVVVIDTLDTARFDLSTFRLGALAHGDATRTLPPGLTSYAEETALPNGMLLQTSAQLDPATGRVVWRFTTLDPVTRQPPEDPFLGFLPPNVNPPEGEGSVTFTVRPRADLADGIPIENRADIFFDTNAPIATPTWVNTLDRARPSSHVLPLAATQADTTFVVRWTGTDGGAGVAGYDVYVQTDGGPFTRWLLNTDATEATFEGEPDRTYGFFSVARDGADNLEHPATEADATTQVVVGVEGGGSLPRVFSLEPNRPNPFTDATTLRYGLPAASRVTLTLYDVLGREVARLEDAAERPAGWHDVRLDGRDLAAGTYLYRIEAGDFTAVRRLTLTR